MTPRSVTAAAPYFYRVSRTRTSARATLQRRVLGPVWVLLRAAIERTDFRSLPGPSVVERDVLPGAGGAPFTDRTVQSGIVCDTRDNDLDPHAGILVEGLFGSGTGYTRTSATARVYAHPTERLVLAARLAGEGLGGTPPLASEFPMESSEQETIALGGDSSLRGYYDARLLGPGKRLGGVEARYAIVRAPSVLELKLVAFYDAGRVFGPGGSMASHDGGPSSRGRRRACASLPAQRAGRRGRWTRGRRRLVRVRHAMELLTTTRGSPHRAARARSRTPRTAPLHPACARPAPGCDRRAA